MKKIIAAAALTAATFGLAACDVEQTEEAELPEVEGGNMPEFDVDAAEVSVEGGTETVEVPTLDVDVEEADAGEPGPDGE
ncbi:hypothetical protein CD351_02415 [Erythrobacter sp. KY5]|uniref:hypothetical protein n=1 Tax=Erythrobacter sp. KY5 TaxID=2011159 RepID=UPI000DBF1AC4|nr:hypothetical protein [Erythrobacter sp. KY5]AWW73277.1 hypothetical protein CD351_02415 [Erythrobacter sp. KY5]